MSSVKRALRRAIALAAPGTHGPGVRVLLYHSIDDPHPDDPMSLRVSREHFVEQMTVLRNGAYEVVPLSAVFTAGAGDGRQRVAVTFDDGCMSQRWAAGVLQDFSFPATFFLVPRFLDGVSTPQAYWEEWGYLGWDDAAALIEDGFEVGAHSRTHVDLRACTDTELAAEVSGAKVALAERLRTNVVSFSYPFGRHDRRVRTAVAAADYRVGCTSRYGVNDGSSPIYGVRRTEIAGTDTLLDFEWKLRGKYDWLGYWQDMTAGRR